MLTSNWTKLSEHKIQRYNKEEFRAGIVEELDSCTEFSAAPCKQRRQEEK